MNLTNAIGTLLSRRILGIAALISVVALTGCKTNQPVTVRLADEAWFLNTLTRTDKIGEFEKTTGIRVDVIDRSEAPIIKDLGAVPARGSSPYDLIVLRSRFLGKLVKERRVQPVGSFLADPSLHVRSFKPKQQLFSNLWQGISWYGSKVYGYPFTDLTEYLCYRKDLLDDAKEKALFRKRYHRDLILPTTWKAYIREAQFFTRPKEHFYGTYIQGQEHLAPWYEWLNFSYSFGGNILDAEHGWEYGDIVLNSPQNLAATRQYLKLIPFSPGDTLNYNWNNALTALEQGRVFMGLLWSDQIPPLEDPSKSKVAGKIGFSVIPSATGRPFSQLEGLTYLIPSHARHPREAYKFMEWAMSPDVQIAQTLQGSLSTLKATYNDPRVKALPYVPVFLDSVPVAIPKPTIPQSPRITEVMVRGLRKVVTRRCSPQQGLDAMALAIRHILGATTRLRFPVKTPGCPN